MNRRPDSGGAAVVSPKRRMLAFLLLALSSWFSFRSLAGEVSFAFRRPDAQRVYLAGDFNGWARNQGGKPGDDAALMDRDGDGTWVKTVTIEADVARYKFIAQDASGRYEWLSDPRVAAKDRDGNSVILVGSESLAGVARTPTIELLADPGRRRLVAVLTAPSGEFRDAIAISGSAPEQGRAEATVLDPDAVAIEWRGDGTRRDFEVRVTDNSRYYGGGERFNAINQKGNVLWMASSDHPEEKGLSTYKPVPFIISSRGYGLWLDSTSPSTFDLNATDREHVVIRDRAPRMRLVLFAGPTPAEVLSQFTARTGRPTVPPAWAFAPWKSRDVHFNREEVIADAELSRKHGLPASVIVLDSPWETGYNDFILNEQQFARPGEMFARIKRLGFVPCLWLTPFVNQSNVTDMKGIDPGPTRNCAEAAERGFLVKGADGKPSVVSWWKGKGALVDFTNPAATQWWQKQLEPTLRWGVAALKCDDGESNFVEDAVFSDGSSGVDMKGRYAELYLRAASDFLELHRPGDHVLIARCGFAGTGKYPFGWAGDNRGDFSFDNGLPGVIIAAQTASLSGLPLWGSDIAGYMGSATPEVFVRWSQFAALTPLMMVHMTTNKGPWDFGDQALDIYRTFARLHTRLYPYTDSAANDVCNRGMPIIRPLALAFPDDSTACEQRFEYLFGPDLLVAPMFQGGTRRSVYLPRGRWIDFWSGELHDGPRTIEAEAPLERMPLYVREGAVVPMLPANVDTLLRRTDDVDPAVRCLDDRRVLEVWPGTGGGAGETVLRDGLRAELRNDAGLHVLRITPGIARDLEVRLRYLSPATRIDHTAGAQASLEKLKDSVLLRVPDAQAEFTVSWE